MDGRPRNYPNGLGDPRGPPSRPSTGGQRGPPSTTSSSSTPSGMSRAERFDDERRRITESCFAKVDDQGQRQYLWHDPKCHTMGLLTISSPGIVHHTHPRPGRWLISAISPTTHRPRIQQESSHRHDFSPKYRKSQAAQGARKRKRYFLHWEVVAYGGPISRRELCAPESQGRRRGATQTMGWGKRLCRDYFQAILLGSWHSQRKGILHWQYGQDLQQIHQG
jgi:hypothetical protein